MLTGLQLGLNLREAGMARALRRSPWTVAAVDRFQRRFASGEEITGEEIRARLIADGLQSPAHRNGWGALTHQLARLGLLADTGRARKAANPIAHARRLVIWRVV